MIKVSAGSCQRGHREFPAHYSFGISHPTVTAAPLLTRLTPPGRRPAAPPPPAAEPRGAGSPPRAHLGLESGAGATPQQAGGRGAGELSACWTPELRTGLKAS